MAGVLAVACGSSSANEPAPSSTVSGEATQSAPANSPTPTATPSSVTLAAVGDLMLGRSIGDRIEADGPGVVFDEAINDVLSGADITAGNLEMVVSEFGSPQPKGYTFRAPLEAVAVLKAAGFDVVSQANNHAMDFGRLALLDTGENLRASGIEPVGAGADIAAASSATVVERNGLRIAFVGLVDAPAEGPGFSRDTWEATASR
ncbi:MAG: CapA family protein, partial [Tepidiformaceae bacterium]